MDLEALYWTKVAAIGQAAGAAATAVAVAVSLWVVLSERTARVSVVAGLRHLIYGGGQPAQEVLSITVTNIGQRPVRIVSIGWRTGWLARFCPAFLAHQYAAQTSSGRRESVDPPYILEPGDQKVMLIDLAPFKSETGRQRGADFFGRKIPVLGLRQTRIRCYVGIAGARTRYFAVEKSLARFLFNGESEHEKKLQARADTTGED